MCWQDITGSHTQAHFFHHFLSSESFSPPSCPPWQLSFCMSWRLSLPSSLAKGIWIQHRASWPPTSPSHLPSVAFCSGRAWRPWYHGHLHHTFHTSPPFCRSFISIFHRRILQLLMSHILQAFLPALPQINWLMVKLVADNFKYFSPVSSCQIKKSQQVRFKPCFSKRQCSFGQQPCPQPPASPESDTPFLCQKKCYRAVWFPPGDLPPSWGLKSRKSCAWNAQCDSFSKHTPLQEQINFIVTWNAKNYQLTKLIRQSVQKKPKRLMCENKKSPAHMANLWICTNMSPKG